MTSSVQLVAYLQEQFCYFSTKKDKRYVEYVLVLSLFNIDFQ